MTNPTASPALLEAALDASDAEERRQATSLIADLPVYDALPLLVRALGDVDWRVRKEATYAARAFVPAPALVAAMVQTFEPCDNVGLRNAAIEVLASSGSAATNALVASLHRLDADGRKLAVQALGSTRDPHALVTLERTLEDPDENVRQGSVEAIAQLGPIAPVEVQRLLFRCLGSPDPFARLAALEGLNVLGAVLPWETLKPLLDHPTLRSAALVAASSSESPDAARALGRMLPKLRGATFLQAISALAKLAEGGLLEDVAAALVDQPAELGEHLVALAHADGNETPAQRASALTIAAIANAKGVVDVAADGLADDTFMEHAERALFLLGPRALPGLIGRIVRSPSEQTAPGQAPPGQPDTLSGDVRAALIEVAASIALSKQAETDAAPLLEALRKATQDEERRVATSALFALSRLGTAADLPLAAQLVCSPIRPLAHAAEGALASLASRHPTSARALCDELIGRGGQREQDAFPAAILLGSLAARDTTNAESASDLDFLARAATAEDVRTRRAAIGAVAEVGGESALSVLSLALADEEREVQLAAARALGYLVITTLRRELEGAPENTSSLRSIAGLVGRSMDPELLATALRSLGEGIVTLPPA